MKSSPALRAMLIGIAAIAAGCAGAPSRDVVRLNDDMTSVDKVKAAMAAGYKISNENGQTLYCRDELQTGSHARYKTKCLTGPEWEQVGNDSRQAVRDMSQGQQPPKGN